MEPPTESPGAGAELKNDEQQEEVEKEDAKKAAPQSQDANESATASAAVSHQDSMQSYEDEMVDCKLTPTDIHNQRQNLKDVLNSETPTLPPPLEATSASNNNIGGSSSLLHASEDHQNHHVQFADDANNSNQHHHQSALHQDEYSQYNNNNNGEYNPNNHESALASSSSLSSGGNRSSSSQSNSNNNNDGNRFSGRKKNRLVRGPTGKKGCSHPRKSPYRSEVARLRHAQQQLERDQGQHGNTNNDEGQITDFTDVASVTSQKSITLKDTTAPPDTSSFAIQSSKFKHSLLHSLGEFLTSAFADDEEASGSYFSQDLLDQLSSSNAHLKGVWLQAKSLNDTHIQQLCDALIRNKVVTEVWLPSNAITDVGAAYIAHMLKFNTTIKELFLGGNDIGPKGAAALAGALARGNTTLVALGLGDNHIGVEGAGAFAAALRHNHSLHTLDIKKNGISKKSSIRGLLNKMLEFNASDPGDESLVMGLQEELANLVSTLPSDMAEHVVLQAEEALKMAMLCRRRGDKVGAAEAEGIFIRICTTGEPPVDPPEEMSVAVEERRSSKRAATKSRQQRQQQQKERNQEPPDVEEGKEEEKPRAAEQQEKEDVGEQTKEELSVPDVNVESTKDEKEAGDDRVVEESDVTAKLEEEESIKKPEQEAGETKNEQQAKESEGGGKQEEDSAGQDEKSETVEDSSAPEGEAVSEEAK